VDSKFIALFRHAQERERPGFRQTFATHTAPAIISRVPGVRRLIANVLDLVQPPGGTVGQDPPYDVIVEIWTDDPDSASSLLAESGCVAVYRVSESIEKDVAYESDAPPRVKLFSFINPVSGLSDHEFRRHWDEHVQIALRVHVPCVQYVRHFVEASSAAGTARVRGVGMIAMRTEEDLRLRMFNSPLGQAEVVADTAEFVGNRQVAYATQRCDLRMT